MVTMTLGYIQPILLLLMLPFTILVALSRMILGLHYPSDVIVGAIIGASVASTIIVLAPSFNILL
jgi:undecaprenyl-diphosphatase